MKHKLRFRECRTNLRDTTLVFILRHSFFRYSRLMNGRRMFPRFGILVLIASQVFLVRSSAQSGACPDSLPSQQKPELRVIVDAVEFQGENPLSEEERAILAAEIRRTEFVVSSATDDDWANEAVEVTVRGALQSKGYFKALPQGTPYLLRAQEGELHYVLRVTMQSGSQYRLGDVANAERSFARLSGRNRTNASDLWNSAACPDDCRYTPRRVRHGVRAVSASSPPLPHPSGR